LLFSLLLTPLAGWLIRMLARSIKRANRRAMEENAQLMSVLSEAFQGMQTVKAFTMEKHERHRFHLVSKKCLRKGMRIALYNALAKPATEILGLAMIFTALIAGAFLVLNQETHILGVRMTDRPISVAALLCFFGLLVGASDPARRLSDLFNSLQAGVAAADRLFPLLDRQPTIVDPPSPRTLPDAFLRLSFRHVGFHYAPDQPVLQDLDFTVKSGETLCIVGPNGCGKSTLVGLLPRFYDPASGSIQLDEIDLREFRLRDLRKFVGLVSQTTLLFDDTVFHNIRYGSLTATKEDVIAAAKRAHAHRFIEEQLERGYDTNVGPGGNRLSGGQRQRIALARAILRDPRLLILDEATSQIDIESEQLIHHALAEFIRDRTAIIITHRLATLELADRILVMEAGRAVDLGTHDELMARCGLYRRLHEIQLRQSA
jgi:ATP-binding cassette subfamily B protein/subfamily B ATP-binding cassette protein MsbA